VESALIVSRSEKGAEYFTKLLHEAGVQQIAALRSGGEARRRLCERDFDLVIINSLLRDESGEKLSCDIASRGTTQVILVVKSEYHDAVSALCECAGVLTIAKPISKPTLWSALMFAKSAHNRIRRMQTENVQLQQKIDDIRIINRAKCMLVSQLSMSEEQAHRYIEKQAMDSRTAKREIAEGIIKLYEN